MRNVIIINTSNCTGCRMCEMGCSMKHFQECNPERSLIRVIKIEEPGLIEFAPSTCMQCETALCELVCPTGAICTNCETGSKVINEQKCIGCSSCSYACPFGAIFLDRPFGRAVVCDFCDGDPMCVKLCSKNALKYVSEDKVNLELKRSRIKKTKETILAIKKIAD